MAGSGQSECFTRHGESHCGTRAAGLAAGSGRCAAGTHENQGARCSAEAGVNNTERTGGGRNDVGQADGRFLGEVARCQRQQEQILQRDAAPNATKIQLTFGID